MAIHSPNMQRLRALKMVEAKAIKGLNNTEISKSFGVSLHTVERTLSWAEQANIFAEYEDRILSGLVPLAYSAVEAALQEGNAKVALEILKGTRLLRTTEKASSPVQQGRDDDMAAYIAAKRDKAQLEAHTITVLPLEGGTYGIPDTTHALAAGPESSDSGSDDAECPGMGHAPGDQAGALTDGGGPPLAPDITHPNAPADSTALGGLV